MMTKEFCRRWIAALRSGDYRKCKGSLKKGNKCGTLYCALGVAEALGAKRSDSKELSGLELPYWTQSKIINLNDDKSTPFPLIADYIEREILPILPESNDD